MEIVILAVGFAGIATILGICIASMREEAKHQRWIEENNKRRYGIK